MCVTYAWGVPQYAPSALDSISSIDVPLEINIPGNPDVILNVVAHLDRIGSANGRLSWILEVPDLCPDYDVQASTFEIVGPVTYTP